MSPIPTTILNTLLLLHRAPSPLPPPPPPQSAALTRRQTGQADPNIGLLIPTSYAGIQGSPQPAAVAGIVLGSILGFLLLVWLIMWAVNAQAIGDVDDEVIEVRSRRDPSERRRSRRSPRRSDVHVERRNSRSRDFSPPRRRTQIVEARVVPQDNHTYPVRGVHISPARSPEFPPPRRHHESDDEVVVIVEDTDYSSDLPPRRSSGRRRSDGY
jgi:hypothetical protein